MATHLADLNIRSNLAHNCLLVQKLQKFYTTEIWHYMVTVISQT